MDKIKKSLAFIIILFTLIGSGCATRIAPEDVVITVTSPVGGERWIAYETRNITWDTNSPRSKVAIFYSKDNFVNDIHTITESAPNTGTFAWRVADDRYDNVKIRVCDTRDLTFYGESPNEFKIDYYTITWNLIDDVSRKPVKDLIMTCSSGRTKHQISSPFSQDYPYGTYTTMFYSLYFAPNAQSQWVADRNKEFTLCMESSLWSGWHGLVNFYYDKDDDILGITFWFTGCGFIRPGIESVSIEIYDPSGSLVETLTSSEPDKDGVVHIQWNNTRLKDNTIYKTKTSCIVSGRAYTNIWEYDLRIPVRSKEETE